jgi:hypothetical protein
MIKINETDKRIFSTSFGSIDCRIDEVREIVS